jgi:hypothetical protein
MPEASRSRLQTGERASKRCVQRPRPPSPSCYRMTLPSHYPMTESPLGWIARRAASYPTWRHTRSRLASSLEPCLSCGTGSFQCAEFYFALNSREQLPQRRPVRAHNASKQGHNLARGKVAILRTICRRDRVLVPRIVHSRAATLGPSDVARAYRLVTGLSWRYRSLMAQLARQLVSEAEFRSIPETTQRLETRRAAAR